MTRTAKHTEPTQNSNTAAYGYKYMYNGFGGSAAAHKRKSYKVHEYWCTYESEKSHLK